MYGIIAAIAVIANITTLAIPLDPEVISHPTSFIVNFQKHQADSSNGNERSRAKMKEVYEKIAAYAKETYTDPVLQISPAVIKQLAWVYNNNYKTNEMCIVESVSTSPLHIEIKRALSRLYCLQLLRTGGEKSHAAFIEAQKRAGNPNPLKESGYYTLSNIVKIMDDHAYQALIASTVVSSVTLSPTAKAFADDRFGQGKYPKDSVEFLAATVEAAADMYPLTETLTPLALQHFKWAFPHHTHFRHMMYTEGGAGMFQVLRKKIESGEMSREQFQFWFLHWMIIITGFRGHLDPKGSLYLDDITYTDIAILKNLLDKFLTDTKLNVEVEYLSIRADMLGIDKENPNRLVLAHLGAMLRLHSKEEGARLTAGFARLSPAVAQKIVEQFYHSLTVPEVTPTYGPALFANFLVASKNDIERTVQVCLPIYIEVLATYRLAVKEGRIEAGVPLNFNDIAGPKPIEALLSITDPEKAVLKIAIEANGVAKLTLGGPEEDMKELSARLEKVRIQNQTADDSSLGSGLATALALSAPRGTSTASTLAAVPGATSTASTALVAAPGAESEAITKAQAKA
jgi:hypothetical protein